MKLTHSSLSGESQCFWRGLRVSPCDRSRGFALISSLTLMVLLVILGVGLLSLSSLSLSSARQGSELAEARANARLALTMAIAQLQEYTGPDQRITASADQLAEGSDGSTSAAADGRRFWTGTYRSWDSTLTTRPEPQFLSWLISGDPTELTNLETAKSSANGNDSIELVGAGTVGNRLDGHVRVPAIEISSSRRGKSRIAWWTGDQGVKSAISSRQRNQPDESLAAVRSGLQSAPRQAVELISTGTDRPFEALAPTDPRLQLVADWRHTDFLASNPTLPRQLFHDIAPFSSGLLTNVRAGGFRKDLSMELERAANRAPDPARTPLYKVGGENGINLQELWAYYNLPSKLTRTGAATYTTGGRISPQTARFVVASGAAACQNDDAFYYKQPVVIAYQMALSFETKSVQQPGTSNFVNRLHVVADPILTFWNPLDVPVVMPTSAFMSVKYWQIPYDFYISVNGGPAQRYPSIAALSSGDGNYLSLRAGEIEQLVFKPGEVIKVSQSGNLNVKSSTSNDHNLVGRSGFNFGGGVSLPVRDASGKELLLNPNDTFTYEVRPNNLTSGKTSSSGNTLNGANAHSRHFSITHHEYYIGPDRGANSLGIGGLYIDFDFGNKRLGANETRGESQPGTKSASQRLYANNFPQVFPAITKSDGRPLNASAIRDTKAPFMLVSFHVKTEASNTLGTRTLARFNPKALHVDFYDLSPSERDILPYELAVIPLNSWKNRYIEVSPNGSAYFGGGLNAEDGVSQVSTHSIPREPITSLAAFQHAFANGFEMQKPRYGYATLNAREPLLPQISHAIGNSMAPPMIPSHQTETTLSGGRPAADHSYLANLALWDDWFLSGIAPQTVPTFGSSMAQRNIATNFLNGTGQLPVARYYPDLGGEDPARVLATLFSGANPNPASTSLTAALIRVDGMFNVNSTSVEAWKALLGSTRNLTVVVRDETGAESIETPSDNTAPVAGLISPRNLVTDAGGSLDIRDAAQWSGRRELEDDEIDALARAIVRQVRKRGPFLSLADFVNRRVSRDPELARAGAIQSALDDQSVPINSAYNGNRGVSSTAASRFTFPEAEEGPASYGIPGIVKQADILTPIAPILSARSDSFIIRAYGESRDASGKVLARAWCEAVVERQRDYFDSTDRPELAADLLTKNVNKTFGRRYDLVAFRWLHPEEV
jgi:type II secretory pathway pseudopilin PulG